MCSRVCEPLTAGRRLFPARIAPGAVSLHGLGEVGGGHGLALQHQILVEEPSQPRSKQSSSICLEARHPAELVEAYSAR